MIAPLIQKKIDKLQALADRAGTNHECYVARAKIIDLKKKYTVPDPKPEPVKLDDDDVDENIGFHFKEEGKEKAI